MLTRISATAAFCLCCSFTTVPLTLRCPVTHDLLYKYTVHWSALQTIFISALLMRSGQNILMEIVWDGVFLKSSATLSGATQRLCDTKTFTARPCQLLLLFSPSSSLPRLTSMGNQITAAVNQRIQRIRLEEHRNFNFAIAWVYKFENERYRKMGA